MDVRSLVGARPTGQPRDSIVFGLVSSQQTAPSTFNDPLFVVLPAHNAQGSIRFDFWPQLHGATLPVAGTAVMVAYDERGVPHVLGWDGPHT